MRHVFAKLMLLAVFLSLPSLLLAQDFASLTGVVTDTSGAVVPGVNVELISTATNTTFRATTNGAGSYTIANVTPGPGYKVTFSRDGFRSVVISGLYMNVDATRTQNAKLPIGNAMQTVEVSASNQEVTLDTTDATIGNNFQVQFLNDLPIQNRDSPAALFTQQPGVTLDGAVTGARVDQNNVTLDGLDVNDNATGNFGAIVGNAPVDSVQEFRGVTAGALSGAGAGGGGQFELVTRSGTNQFHGALVEYHRDTDLEANNWFNNNNGVARPPLIRNQFGGNVGGPILRNRLFFFFDYNGRRDTLSNLVEQTVPLDSFRDGNVSYVNTTGGISVANSTGLDPQKKGFNANILSLLNTRYPHANDLTGQYGDHVNTAGFRFNAPFPLKEDDYVQKVDYTINSKMRVFGRGTFTKTNATQNPIQFPGDPETFPFLDQSYSWVAGHTWTIKNNMVNQASYGETFENYDFPDTFNPNGATQYTGFGGTGSGGSFMSTPYASAINAQGRTYPIPIIRDDFTWEKGRHSIAIGGTFKWDTPDSYSILNYDSPSIGLGGFTTALTDSLRPSDIDPGSTQIYDSAYAFALAPFTAVSSTFNYNNKGAVQPQGSGQDLKYRYYETEVYVGDTWKITPSLTLSYGLRYQNFTVPYEVNGLESRGTFQTLSPNAGFDQYFALRNAQSASGLSGNSSLPFMQYGLAGKANNAAGYYQPNNKNFAPRFAFAYSPSFDRKTVFNGGAGILYDHTVINAIQYQQSQNSYLFQSSNTVQYGIAGDAVGSLLQDQRFGSLTTPAPPPVAPTIQNPLVPYVDSTGAPFGLANGLGNRTIDANLKTPYSIQYNFGFQHEFPQGYILKASYVGRMGRRLVAQADASQLIDFPDNTGKSNQKLSTAMANVTQQLRNHANAGALQAIYGVTPQPWFENQFPGFAAEVNAVNAQNGVTTNLTNSAQAVAYEAYPYPQRGDFADAVYLLSAIGVLPPNVGLASQFAVNGVYTNKGFSSYNGMLVSLHKNAGYGLQFDLNYTWSHSIDNTSFTANSPAGGLTVGYLCDVNRPRECRGNSDFDVSNYLNGNFIYALPFGRGRAIGATVPWWLNEAVGGWAVSGLPSWHTGNAYNISSNAFVAGFSSIAPATLVGPSGLLKAHVGRGSNNSVNAYADPTAALDAYVGPLGFNIGSRNNLRGPGYFNIDLGLAKTFPIWEDKVNLKFRADAFNATNHPSFSIPEENGLDITEAAGVPFGTINSTASTARVMQLALRLEF
ncbi:carboxypeptidase-like regulatory domain-containing protein [Acidicapsa ligni]|uniref:carboxypeptidase-like regulatory domain-containing protein n=1 Tax=Acidicapsa ligni TaxID=542300 RepID=UPI0021DF9402|nr:carboxypeptidase-like regulatory domain-containing protein [Acidicapsa ligni]